MSLQSLRYPSPASGDVAAATGRHRRPESLADSRPRLTFGLPPNRSFVPPQRAAGHQRNTPARRLTKPGRRTAAHRTAAHRTAVNQRPITGSHRAPGTLPIESWLLMDKKRQQVLLASLIAVGLLLVAVPGTRGNDKIDAVNAAAQRAATQAAQKAEPGGGSAASGEDGAAATPSASTPVLESTSAARQQSEAKKTGPANSMRTTGTTAVALTFDDGPDPVQTPKILALLDKYQIKATFCLVGKQVQKHPEIVQQIVAAGHALCNHTWNHSYTIGKEKPAQIKADLARTTAAIQAAVPGGVSVPFFRAPGGYFTDRLVSVAASGGMTSLYWEVDPEDWDHQKGETDEAHIARVIAQVKKHVRAGSIVLSHDFNQPDTIAAYEKLLPWLKENFTLGIPGEPAPAETTSPTPSPTPSETAASPEPSATATAPTGTAAPTES